MEGLIILVIWFIVNIFIRGSNNKNTQEKTKHRNTQYKGKNILSTFMEDLEKEMKSEKEKQRPGRQLHGEQPAQLSQPVKPAKPTRPIRVSDSLARPEPIMVSDLPARPEPTVFSDLTKPEAPPKRKAAPKPVGLEIDVIGGDEEIGGSKEAGIYKGAMNNNLDLDLKRDLVKGIIYSEILSEPKSIKNMKRRV